MADYDRDLLDEMCSKVNLLEYAENTMEFRRSGNDSYVTCCPLHNEKTASFSISPSRNMWHCFGCGQGGSVLSFLMKVEKLPFDKAVEKLSQLSGMDIKNLKQCSCIKSFKEIKRVTSKSRIEKIDRKILDLSVLDKFDDEIPQEWLDEGITIESMKKHMVKIDKWANRIVYPVWDNDEKLIGVKGRTRYKNFKCLDIAKYMNYYPIKICDFFQGMNVAFQKIQKVHKTLVFEGIKSVMKVEAWGYEIGISSETSYLNEYQVRILVSMGVKDVTLCYDKGVSFKKIADCTKMLRRFCNVYVIIDKHNLLDKDDAPCDKGREVFERLLAERVKI